MDSNYKGVTIWFTGLPCSGKTTIATKLEKILAAGGVEVERLDGDIFRNTISKDLGFSKEDRDKNLDRVIYISEMLTRHGVIVLSSFVSPYAEKRNFARDYIPNFMEVYVDCPVNVCEQRDVKGHYALARKGIITDFTGVSGPYEEPSNPELVLHTAQESVGCSVKKILDKLSELGYINEFANKFVRE